MSMKYLSLLALAIQNSALTLLMRQSRTTAGPRYLSSTAVILSELIKTSLSLIILVYSSLYQSRYNPTTSDGSISNRKTSHILSDVFAEITKTSTIIPITIPAILYTVQNNLQYLAATNLDAGTFAVLYQGKVLTTAIFAVLILRQKLSGLKWAAISVLTGGIILISYPSEAKLPKRGQVEGRVVGLFAVFSACIVSGFAGVFLELIFKKAKNAHSTSSASQLWVRNAQLSGVSIIIACSMSAFVDGQQILKDGFFQGYNHFVWSTIMLQAAGGLIVSLVITYADNILKGFATSLSLVGSTTVSAMIGDCVLTQQFIFGVALVLGATNMYVMGSEKKRPDQTLATTEETEPLNPDIDEKQDIELLSGEKAQDLLGPDPGEQRKLSTYGH